MSSSSYMKPFYFRVPLEWKIISSSLMFHLNLNYRADNGENKNLNEFSNIYGLEEVSLYQQWHFKFSNYPISM